MLQKIRDRVSGWIAGVVIVLVGGAFILFGVEYYFDQNPNNQNTAATVDGVAITSTEVSNAFTQIQRKIMMELHGQPLTEAMTEQLKAYALQSLVTQTALYTTLTKDGFHVGMPQIKAMVMQAPQFQDKGKFSEQKMMETLYVMGYTPQAFFQQMQTRWVVNQVTQSVALSGFALPSEVNQWYGLEHQQRAFGYLIVPMQSFMSKVTVSDADIKNYYTDNQSTFETPAQVSVAYIVLSPTDIAKTVTVTDAEAKAYYESHPENFSKKQTFDSVKNKIITLMQHQRVNQLLTKKSNALADLTYTNPDSLAIAAKALNLPIQMSPMISKTGEKTGIFANPKVLATIFSDSVFKSDNNSNPITLPDGSQIVLRIQKKEPSQPIPLATESAQIKQQLTEKRAEAQAGLLAYQLQKKISNGDNPEITAKQNGLAWHAVSLTDNKEKSTPPAILKAAFSIPVSTTAKNKEMGSQAISVNQHDYAVIAVTQVKNADPKQASVADHQKLALQLSTLWGQLMQRCFVDSVIAGAHVVISKQ